MKKFLISIDAGTTSNRSILFDLKGKPVFSSQKAQALYDGFQNSAKFIFYDMTGISTVVDTADHLIEGEVGEAIADAALDVAADTRV